MKTTETAVAGTIFGPMLLSAMAFITAVPVRTPGGPPGADAGAPAAESKPDRRPAHGQSTEARS